MRLRVTVWSCQGNSSKKKCKNGTNGFFREFRNYFQKFSSPLHFVSERNYVYHFSTELFVTWQCHILVSNGEYFIGHTSVETILFYVTLLRVSVVQDTILYFISPLWWKGNLFFEMNVARWVQIFLRVDLFYWSVFDHLHSLQCTKVSYIWTDLRYRYYNLRNF